MQKQQDILKFIKEEMLDEEMEISFDASLFRSGLLDSLKMARLIVFLEKTYEIKIATIDIIYNNFDSINNMVAFVERKFQNKI